MFDDFDLYETCEEYYSDKYFEELKEWEEEQLSILEDWDEEPEREDFPDDYWLEVGFNPYEGCYDWDC